MEPEFVGDTFICIVMCFFPEGSDEEEDDNKDDAEKEELEKEMGDLGEEDAEKLDDQIWGSDDEDEKEEDKVLENKILTPPPPQKKRRRKIDQVRCFSR